MKIKPTQRIEFIDSVKGFAIFCVLWGHCIQYLKDNADFFHNPVFEFIYSFHIPLFFVVSGFFFKSSLKLNYKDFFQKKFFQLLLPCIIWLFYLYIIHIAKYFYTRTAIDWNAELQFFLNLPGWPFWFLRDLFLSYSIAFIAFKILKKEWMAFVCSILAVFLIPGFSMQQFLFPFFWIGIFLKDNYPFVREHLKWFLWGSGIVFLSCLFFWKGDFTIYVTIQQDITNLNISLFRLLIGFAGSLFFFTLFQKLYKENKFWSYLSVIGTHTLSIYILQWVILEQILARVLDFSTMNNWIFNLLITPFIAFIVLCVCMVIIKQMKNKYLRLLVLGSKD